VLAVLPRRFPFWFAVQVVPRFEARIAILLEQKGYLTFLPTHKVNRRWANRAKILELPLFPGYVFCRDQEQAAGLIVATSQVIRIVGFGAQPSPIDDQDIDALRKLQNSGLPAEPCSYLRIGDRVQIKNGPLSGVTGILAQIRNSRRLVISVDAIMKSVSVEIDEIQVSPSGKVLVA
jgi:transcription antitermination factor NusG